MNKDKKRKLHYEQAKDRNLCKKAGRDTEKGNSLERGKGERNRKKAGKKSSIS
jgi:hypothetical protein